MWHKRYSSKKIIQSLVSVGFVSILGSFKAMPTDRNSQKLLSLLSNSSELLATHGPATPPLEHLYIKLAVLHVLACHMELTGLHTASYSLHCTTLYYTVLHCTTLYYSLRTDKSLECQLKVKSVHDTVYTVHSTVFCELYNEHQGLCSMQFELCSVQYVACSFQCALFSVQFVVFSIQCAVLSVQYIVCSIQCAGCSVQYSVCNVQCALFSVQCWQVEQFHKCVHVPQLGPDWLEPRQILGAPGEGAGQG